MADINIKETIFKRFKLRGLGENFSEKTIDITNINKKIGEKILKKDINKFIFEKGKEISFEDIEKIVSESDERKINSFFDKKAWINDKFSLLQAILKFNPYKHVKKLNEIEGFWDYYYAYSKDMILIPNVLKERTPYDEEGKAQEKEIIITLEEYKKYVEEIYEIFKSMNNKPIFVPISIRLDMNELQNLITYYLSKEFFYMWIDFEGKPADPSNSAIYAKILRINSILRKSSQFEKCILYITNIKREITSNLKEPLSPASNILTSLCGANIVGKNKAPKRKFSSLPDNSKKIVQHKARVFNPNTYYYQMVMDPPFSRKQNITSNAEKISKELDKQKKEFLKEFNIKDYLGNKKMIQEYGKGKILSSIDFGKKVKRGL